MAEYERDPGNHIYAHVVAEEAERIAYLGRLRFMALPRQGDVIVVDIRTYEMVETRWTHQQDGYGGTVYRPVLTVKARA